MTRTCSGVREPCKCPGQIGSVHDPIPVVAGDAHRAHDPPYEVNYGEVVRPAYERVERAERIREALSAAGHPLVEPADHGMDLILAVYEPALVGFLEGVAGLEAAGGPEVLIPDSFPIARLGRGGGRDLSGVSAALAGSARHRDPAGRRELRRRGGRRRRRPDRGRPGGGRGAGRLRLRAGPRLTTPVPATTAALPAQQRRHRGLGAEPGGPGGGGGRRLPPWQRHPGHLLG